MKVDHQHQQMGDVPLPPVITRVSSSPFLPRASERRVLLIVGVCQTFSHLHIFTSHLQILTSSHPHILTSSHLFILTSSHLHICSSSHLLIFTSAHLHIFSSSHLLIFTASHLHILTSSHLLIFTSSHLHIFSSSHLLIFTSHLYIFSSSHPHILTSSHPHIFTSSHSLLPSCSLALSFFLLFHFSLKARGNANETARNAALSHETRLDRQKLRWNCDFTISAATISHETSFDRQKLCSEIAILIVPRQPFRTKRGSIAKNCGKIAI